MDTSSRCLQLCLPQPLWRQLLRRDSEPMQRRSSSQIGPLPGPYLLPRSRPFHLQSINTAIYFASHYEEEGLWSWLCVCVTCVSVSKTTQLVMDELLWYFLGGQLQELWVNIYKYIYHRSTFTLEFSWMFRDSGRLRSFLSATEMILSFHHQSSWRMLGFKNTVKLASNERKSFNRRLLVPALSDIRDSLVLPDKILPSSTSKSSLTQKTQRSLHCFIVFLALSRFYNVYRCHKDCSWQLLCVQQNQQRVTETSTSHSFTPILPKSQLDTCDCGVKVVEEIIADSAPLAVVVDFQTSLARSTTACQSDPLHWKTIITASLSFVFLGRTRNNSSNCKSFHLVGEVRQTQWRSWRTICRCEGRAELLTLRFPQRFHNAVTASDVWGKSHGDLGACGTAMCLSHANLAMGK